MKIVVVGAGAMGSIYGGFLSKCNDVYMVDTNQDLVGKIQRQGIAIETDGVEEVFFPHAGLQASEIGESDLVILFVKSMFSHQALESIKAVIGENTYLMTLQNGAGHEHILSDFVPKERIIIGTTEANGYVMDLAHVHHGGGGVTNIGRIVPGDGSMLSQVKDAFDRCGFEVRIKENIQQLVWDKLMINASLSSLTAILQVDIGFVARNKSAQAMMRKLIEEAVSVATAMGLEFDVETVYEKVLSVSKNNPDGKTSISVDILHGRKTEVETINGAVVRAAASLGIPVPTQQFVVLLIHALEGKGNV